MSTSRRRPPRVFAIVLLLIAAVLLYGGIRLLALGGSAYYGLAGLTLLACAVLLWRGNPHGSHLYGAFLLATLVWSLVEAGTDLWALAPRIGFFAVVGLWLLTPFVRRGLYSPDPPPPLLGTTRSKGIAAASVLAAVAIILLGTRSAAIAVPARRDAMTSSSSAPAIQEQASAASGEWPHYGNTTHGTRYAKLDQINSSNVASLQEIWRYRTGRTGQFKATPLQVGELLYFCTAMNVIVALDAETGERRWQYDPELKIAPVGFNATCRGVSYHRAPSDYTGECAAKILTATTDARLIAVDALTGERCRNFGRDGTVDLLAGIGEVKTDFYFVTSPPLIARDRIVVGARIADNFEVSEPSGVIRAYDAITGQFSWAWDMGRPGINTEPAAGEEYTRGTPNVWTLMSYDDALGLVYAPTGNSTPDFFGAHRSPVAERYASSIVALDIADGSVRWSYQTVHHDVWDYDLPSQPALVDLRRSDGSIVPALVQLTKRGEVFLFDRRDGTPLAPIEERPVPQGPVPGEWLAQTQPFSTGMPQFRGPDFTEADMWGLTPFDQLWCRTEFRKLRYEGHFTPPSIEGTLVYPGNAGGFNWGSAAVDEERRLLVVAPLLMASRLSLIPRAQVPKTLRRYLQLGTPYAASIRPFMSPLFVPCTKPPYGQLAVVDMQTRQVVWSRRLGTTNESGPLGMKIGLALPMGVPLTAGPIVTQGGLIFFGSGMDRYFRAFDLSTGAELWRQSLPGPSQATPMSYRSPRGRQFIVITVPGSSGFGMAEGGAQSAAADPLGGHVIAYALP